MTQQWKKTGLMVGLLFLVLALLIGSCAPTPTEGERRINVALSLALTGSLASTVAPPSNAALDYLKYVNEELGGIECKTSQGEIDRVKLNVSF